MTKEQKKECKNCNDCQKHQQKAFELEESIDLSKIEAEATSRLGMHRPEKHQIVYIDVMDRESCLSYAEEAEIIGHSRNNSYMV